MEHAVVVQVLEPQDQVPKVGLPVGAARRTSVAPRAPGMPRGPGRPCVPRHLASLPLAYTIAY